MDMDTDQVLFTIVLRDGQKITGFEKIGFFRGSELDLNNGLGKLMQMISTDGTVMINIENVMYVRLADDVERRSYDLFHNKEGDVPCS